MHLPAQHKVAVTGKATINLNEDSLTNHNKEHLQEAQYTSQVISAGPWAVRPKQFHVGKAEIEEEENRAFANQSSINFPVKILKIPR